MNNNLFTEEEIYILNEKTWKKSDCKKYKFERFY